MTDRITLLIKAKNLSAAQFADEIGVQRSSISHLMSGRNKPSLDLIQKTLQRFPEVSTEWLLLGKGEMVRGMNLFNSQAREDGTELSEKYTVAVDSLPEYSDREPTLFAPGTQGTNTEVIQGIEAKEALNAAREDIAEPSPHPAENAKRIDPSGREPEDNTASVINKVKSKKGCAIDQIIVFYDDRTFIAYSPGN